VFRRLDPFGNPNVGVYVRATSAHVFVPPGITALNVADIEAALGLNAIQLTIGGSPLVGSLVAANRRGAVVADFATDAEIAILQAQGLDVMRLERTRLNAAGNNIVANDKGAILHPDMSSAAARAIEDVLGVPVERGAIGGVPTVGTAAVATNKGVLCHPLTSEEERNFIKSTLHAHARIGTVNHGHGLVGAGLAANQHGAAVGTRTTGIELGRIEEALGFLEPGEA
jgi:translation initiation factor 6